MTVLIDDPARYDRTLKDSQPQGSLTYIRGIGAMKKRWLKAIGIETVQDLAHASATELERQLRESKHPVSLNEIATWIAQAQAFVEESTSAAKANLADDSEGEAIAHETIAWTPQAAFAIEFQTREVNGQTEQRTLARHVETNAIEVWSGIASEHLQPWMRSRLGSLQVQSGHSPDQTEPVRVEITQLRLLQSSPTPPRVATPTQRLFPGTVKPGEPFALEISLQFTQATTTSPTITSSPDQQIVYCIQCQVRHLPNGLVTPLSELQANVPLSHDASYTAHLSDLVLREPGAYRLQVLVTLQNFAAASACFKVPMLQVI